MTTYRANRGTSMIKIESNCSSRMTDEEMRYQQGQGIHYLAVNFIGDDANYDGILRFFRFPMQAARSCRSARRFISAAKIAMSGSRSTTSSREHLVKPVFRSTTSHGSRMVSSVPESVPESITTARIRLSAISMK